ncbi:MAG: DMT family transporter [Alkalispirochaeta sp.]
MSDSDRRRNIGVLYILIAGSLWGALGPISKAAFAEGVSPPAVAFWRALFGWLFFVIHAGARRSLAIDRRDIPAVIAFALVSVSGFFGSYQIAIHFGGAARASVLLYTAPAWVAIMAVVILKERIRVRTVVSVVVAIVGVALISLSGTGEGRLEGANPVIGIVFGLISGFTYALYYIAGRRLLERYPPLTLFSWILVIGAAGLLPFVSVRIPSVRAALVLLLIGFATTYCAYVTYSLGLMRLRSSQAAVIATFEPVVAAVLAYFFWDEYLGLGGYLGAVLVITGVVIQSLPARRGGS